MWAVCVGRDMGFMLEMQMGSHQWVDPLRLKMQRQREETRGKSFRKYSLLKFGCDEQNGVEHRRTRQINTEFASGVLLILSGYSMNIFQGENE